MQTPLLELKNIGKIYVSEGNVAVGIRGVNLSFERGEFVAVTGKSGSGKSTLLNVISGMDTYEEGELLVEGEPTSHFLQKDWEEYRKQYISFIFQEYNIIESFTVLQNVELALMNIENPRERRERALELLRRVGLEGHIHHKGSKLSGGQKQRTVIARALAKDSPILLCDEPTGNLDSKSSEEIIELLREVSRDKLVIIVTHNFEQVQKYATRHVRIFDGAVESDHTVRPPSPVSAQPSQTPATITGKLTHTLRSGLHLGRVRFTATPKLSVFLCILMVLTALTLTLITSLTYDSRDLWDEKTMFTHSDGRTVIVRQDGAIITEEELQKLAVDMGAENYLHYDNMLDETVNIFIGDEYNADYYRFSFGYPAESIKLDAGRYPEADNEVIMEVPVSVKPYLGGDRFEERDQELFNMAVYRVVGVRYYYDNTRQPRLLFTENGYKIASAIAFFGKQNYNFSYAFELSDPDGIANTNGIGMDSRTYVDFSMAPGTYFVNHSSVDKMVKRFMQENPAIKSREDVAVKGALSGSFRSYKQDYYFEYYSRDVMVEPNYGYGEEATVTYALDQYKNVWDLSDSMKEYLSQAYYADWDEEASCFTDFQAVILSPDILMNFLHDEYYTQAYTQASLFFKNDREAHGKVEKLRELGYIAVVSDETIQADVFELLEEKLLSAVMALLWVFAIVFITVFLSLCSSRAMNATRGDVGIMRSMGIPTAVVKISIYVQTLLALIPAAAVTAITCAVIFTLPKTNYLFPFLHAADYALVAAVMLLIALNLSRKYVKKMFDQSVKKTLRSAKGGSKS